MDNYVQLLDESFDLAEQALGHDELGSLFFENFFSNYPETKIYFKGTDIAYFGGKKLNIIFVFLKDIIEHPNFAEGHITMEVGRHQMYGLSDREYYFGLVNCLSITLKNVLGSSWSSLYDEAWNDTSMAFKSIVNEAFETYI
ncbi:Uncharacterised protein [BD1-7 clade bacterium]|uniref:Globin domain-containing protein n=1 Tax=BD1-7 clade bacterium TaxID=2029982 RepID=A0A5S9R1Y9_9GAMM|nr:Uncharacterised protein [BD1-7 clade bacterium]